MAGKASMDVELLPDGSWKTLEPKNPDKSKSTAECASPPAKVPTQPNALVESVLMMFLYIFRKLKVTRQKS